MENINHSEVFQMDLNDEEHKSGDDYNSSYVRQVHGHVVMVKYMHILGKMHRSKMA